jgi:hypothetical protein
MSSLLLASTLAPNHFRSGIRSCFLPFLVAHFRTPLTNESQPRVFALKSSSDPAWELSQSEEKEALENTSLALRKHAGDARQAFDNERNVDWVIM